MKPLVSVVIPVYNVEAYVGDCLDSILSQNYENVEVIVVDDCSPDNSIDIVQNRFNKYSGVKTTQIIRHSKNHGLSAARNTGLDVADGDLIMLVDSDDTICENCISELVEMIMTSEADIAAASVYSTDEQGKIIGQKIQPEAGVVDGRSFLSLCNNGDCISTVWNKIYRKSIFNLTRFDYGMPIAEDIIFNNRLFLWNQDLKIFVSSKPLFNYRIRTGTLSRYKADEKLRPYLTTLTDIILQNKETMNYESYRVATRNIIGTILSSINRQPLFDKKVYDWQKEVVDRIVLASPEIDFRLPVRQLSAQNHSYFIFYHAKTAVKNMYNKIIRFVKRENG